MRLKGLAKVSDLERGSDFDRFDELRTTIHDVPDKTKSAGNVGLEKREDVIDCRRVPE